MAKILETKGLTVTKTVAEFLAFDRIVTYDQPGKLTDTVSLRIASTGVIDFSTALEGVRDAEIIAYAGGNTITAGDGNDTIYGSAAADTLNGGKGNDTIYSNDTPYGNKAPASGSDILNGGDGDDTIYSSSKNDTVNGGAGADIIRLYYASGRTSKIDGGAGLDRLLANGDVTKLSISGVEVLETGFKSITITAAQLASFEWIGAGVGYDESGGNLWLSGAGSVDLSRALGGVRKVSLHTSKEGNTITAGDLDDQLYGNAGNDILSGGAGDDEFWDNYSVNDSDTFNGNGGNDTINAWGGNDTVNGGDGNDYMAIYRLDGRAVIANGGSGWDTMLAYGNMKGLTVSGVEVLLTEQKTITATTAQLGSFERIIDSEFNESSPYAITVILSGSGSINFSKALQDRGSVVVTLSAEGNTVTGGARGDTFIAGAKADTINGGNGVDTVSYAAAASGVTLHLANGALNTGGAAGDRYSSVENLIGSRYDDSLAGNDGDNFLNGGNGNDVLSGGKGNDTLDGGLGADTMIGNTGNDTYVVASSDDKIVEKAGEGTDLVRSALSYTLASNLENLTLIGTSNIKGTGNSLANTIVGNLGNNIIDGGTGADTMIGGKGNDTYVVTGSDDKIVEKAGEGTDLVRSALSYTLASNLENLTLTDTSNIKGTGNSLANTIVGNSGNNIIDGGTGADTMIGGKGNDTYVVASSDDKIVEKAGEGTDLARSSASYTLASDIENLTLTGAADITGAGNSLANTIVGNSGHNILDGGLGKDVLIGGSGSDTFVFSTKLGLTNIDKIQDFATVHDTIWLDDDVFAKVGKVGLLASSAFHIGTKAYDSSDRIIYDKSTGKLWYDFDGSGKGEAIQFAQLAPGLALTEASFEIIV